MFNRRRRNLVSAAKAAEHLQSGRPATLALSRLPSSRDQDTLATPISR